MNTRNSITVFAVDKESFTHADICISVTTHSDTGIVANCNLYLTQGEAEALLTLIGAHVGPKNGCDHTKFSDSWRDCDKHPEVECFAKACDNCNAITSRDCEEI